MVNIVRVSDNLKSWFMSQVDSLSSTNPAMKFAKPFITRAVDKKFGDVTKALEWVTDDNGNIDVEAILNEVIASVKEPQVFTINTPYVGDIEVGNGTIKLNVPMTDKRMLFKIEDLEFLKETLIE